MTKLPIHTLVFMSTHALCYSSNDFQTLPRSMMLLWTSHVLRSICRSSTTPWAKTWIGSLTEWWPSCATLMMNLGAANQCLFVRSGSSWITDDGRAPVRCPIVDPVRRAAYMYWLVPQDALSLWWRRPVEELADLSDLLATAFSNWAVRLIRFCCFSIARDRGNRCSRNTHHTSGAAQHGPEPTQAGNEWKIDILLLQKQ